MGMEQWWNDTNRGKTDFLREKYYSVLVVDGWTSMEQWSYDTYGGNLNYWEKKIIELEWYI
jgi:hypothetical protein